MPVECITVPCLSDNYAFLIHNAQTGETALIDAPEAAPIKSALTDLGWTLTDILITHHHPDHINGVAALRRGARVIGAAADAHRLPPLDVAVSDGETIDVCGERAEVMDVSGHTVGHIAFYLPQSQLVFTADSLMALGCGRLFEGTPEQMWKSLQKLRALPAETLVCSGHEYTKDNARFAATLEADNPRLTSRISEIEARRAQGEATVPSKLAEECQTNPFLRADDPALKSAIGMPQASDVEVFAEIRSRKDRF